MRALFYEHSKNLKDGTYVFVAKVGLFNSSHVKFSNDFIKVLKRSKSLQDVTQWLESFYLSFYGFIKSFLRLLDMEAVDIILHVANMHE